MITRDELIQMQRALEHNKIWGGAGWIYNPCHYFKYKKVLDIINRELEIINLQEGSVITNDSKL